MNLSWASEPSTLGWIFFLFDFSLRIWFSARIVRRKLPAGVAWAWLSVIMFLPILGTLLYVFFGEFRQGRRRVRRLKAATENMDRIAKQRMSAPDFRSGVRGDQAMLANAFFGMMGLPSLADNDIELLANAGEAFPRLLADIEAAQSSIDLEFYIWSDGGRANLFGDALMRAARRGVKCRLLVDAIGSSAFVKGESFQKLQESGVKIVVALPSGFWRSLFARPDLRIHRKIAVIDRSIAYTGSMNLADPEFFKIDAGVGQWVDAFARVLGPAVDELYGVFLSDWCAETGEGLIQATPTTNRAVNKQAAIQCLPSGPAVKDSVIEQALIMCLYSARKEITLTTPYFIPSEALMFALIAAARRGVRTTLIVPQYVDSKLTQYASRSFFQDLISAGAVVALYKPGLLHTKTVTIDQEFCLFGSLNLDQRSLRINFEITLAVYDERFTKSVCALQKSYLDNSLIYTMSEAQKQSSLTIWKSDLARLLSPLL